MSKENKKNPEVQELTEDQKRNLKAKNYAVFLGIIAFVVIVFFVSIIRMKGG